VIHSCSNAPRGLLEGVDSHQIHEEPVWIAMRADDPALQAVVDPALQAAVDPALHAVVDLAELAEHDGVVPARGLCAPASVLTRSIAAVRRSALRDDPGLDRVQGVLASAAARRPLEVEPQPAGGTRRG